MVHYISGVTIYKILAPTEFMKWTFTSPSAYSIVYNGSYMLPNTIMALVIAAVLYKPLKKVYSGSDLLVSSAGNDYLPNGGLYGTDTPPFFARYSRRAGKTNGFFIENDCSG